MLNCVTKEENNEELEEEKKQSDPVIGSSLIDQPDPILHPKTEINLESQHMFHKECITQWFFKKAECPMCRKSFLQEI